MSKWILHIFSIGATLSLWLCRWPQIRALFDTGVDAGQTLPRLFRLKPWRRGSKPRRPTRHCPRMPTQKFRCDLWMLCLTAQLLFPPVLLRLSWHWLILRIKRVTLLLTIMCHRHHVSNIQIGRSLNFALIAGRLRPTHLSAKSWWTPPLCTLRNS